MIGSLRLSEGTLLVWARGAGRASRSRPGATGVAEVAPLHDLITAGQAGEPGR